MKKAVKITTVQGNNVVICPAHITSIVATGGIVGNRRVYDIRLSGGETYQYGVYSDTEHEGLISLTKSLGLS